MATRAQWQARTTVTLDIKKLQWLQREAKGKVARAIEASAERVNQGARRYCPVDTGLLKSTIDKLRVGELAWIVTYAIDHPEVFYGYFQELGSRFQSGTPFLVPALEDERPNLPKGIKAEFVKL